MFVLREVYHAAKEALFCRGLIPVRAASLGKELPGNPLKQRLATIGIIE
jgi:hypothetical protein